MRSDDRILDAQPVDRVARLAERCGAIVESRVFETVTVVAIGANAVVLDRRDLSPSRLGRTAVAGAGPSGGSPRAG
jgi:hypothetical protein